MSLQWPCTIVGTGRSSHKWNNGAALSSSSLFIKVHPYMGVVVCIVATSNLCLNPMGGHNSPFSLSWTETNNNNKNSTLYYKYFFLFYRVKSSDLGYPIMGLLLWRETMVG